MPSEINHKRLDVILFDKGLVQSRERARALIMSGKVMVNDQIIDKPGLRIPEDATLLIKEDLPFVSRGGLKLEAALNHFQIEVQGRICLDVGASTGGFTDCLLQHGAERVFAVDVGYGQLAWKLRQDPRVVVIERTNVRSLLPERVHGPIDLVVIDVSFISLKIVIPCTLKFLKPGGRMIALIKPQFEVGKDKVGKGGVVRDPQLHAQVIADISSFSEQLGLSVGGALPSPILGPKGNREFLLIMELKQL